jgi:hypothetical protein
LVKIKKCTVTSIRWLLCSYCIGRRIPTNDKKQSRLNRFRYQDPSNYPMGPRQSQYIHQ